MSVPPDQIDPTRRQFIGIDNMNPETATTPGHVRDAVNVDMRRGGARPKRRAGQTKFRDTTSAHSAWGDGVFPWAFFVDEGTLYGIQRRDDAPVAIVTGLGHWPVSFASTGERVFWSDGLRGGLITMDAEAFPWACEAPPGPPSVAPAAGVGGLAAGRYQVAVTFRDSLGRESGTPRTADVEIAAGGGGITLTNIPQPASSSVVGVRVYATPANGDVLYHVRDIPLGLTTLTIGAGDAQRKVLGTLFHEPLPFGHLIGFGHARVWSGADNTLYWSEALRYAQAIVAHNRIRMPGRITMLAPVGDGQAGAGVFVSAGKTTLFLAGADPHQFRMEQAYQHAAIEESLAWASGQVWGLETRQPVPSWLAADGQFCVGLPGGVVQTFNAQTVAAEYAARGASLIREVAGIRQQITTLQDPMTQRVGLRDRLSSTVHRNGLSIDP